MGVQTWVLISDPYIAHEVMAKSVDRPYTTFSHKYSSHGGKGVAFSTYSGKYWKKARSAGKKKQTKKQNILILL
jgi:hypothetical protein